MRPTANLASLRRLPPIMTILSGLLMAAVVVTIASGVTRRLRSAPFGVPVRDFGDFLNRQLVWFALLVCEPILGGVQVQPTSEVLLYRPRRGGFTSFKLNCPPCLHRRCKFRGKTRIC